jgi:hypothetical protein
LDAEGEVLKKEEGSSHRTNRKDEEDEPHMKPVLYKMFNAGAWGCRQMRSLVVCTMVLVEFVMLYCFATHEFSFLLLKRNVSFPLAWIPMLAVLLSYIYLPVYIIDQGFAPLDGLGVMVALVLVVVFYVIFELAKVFHNSMFEEELVEKTVVSKLLSEGRLHAFPSREEAWIKCPTRRPLLSSSNASDCKENYVTCRGSKPSTRPHDTAEQAV